MTNPVSHDDTDALARRFPRLFAPERWEWGNLDTQFSLDLPPDELVSNVHLLARTGGELVVCRNDKGWRFLPGGTREPDEPIEQTARRELREEAGARLDGPLRWIGAHRGDHNSPGPYRPHLPYPVSYWLYATADVTLDGMPTNPPDGEQVLEVLALPPAQAADWLAEYDVQMGELVRLAAELGYV
jgi:8-oxo-dGTP diphosphatase